MKIIGTAATRCTAHSTSKKKNAHETDEFPKRYGTQFHSKLAPFCVKLPRLKKEEIVWEVNDERPRSGVFVKRITQNKKNLVLLARLPLSSFASGERCQWIVLTTPDFAGDLHHHIGAQLGPHLLRRRPIARDQGHEGAADR